MRDITIRTTIMLGTIFFTRTILIMNNNISIKSYFYNMVVKVVVAAAVAAVRYDNMAVVHLDVVVSAVMIVIVVDN